MKLIPYCNIHKVDNLYNFSLSTYVSGEPTELIISGRKTELGMGKVKKKGEGNRESLKVRKKYQDRITQFYQ